MVRMRGDLWRQVNIDGRKYNAAMEILRLLPSGVHGVFLNPCKVSGSIGSLVSESAATVQEIWLVLWQVNLKLPRR